MNYTDTHVGVGGRGHIRFCRQVSTFSLKTPLYVHDYVWQSLYQDQDLSWGENVSQSGLVLGECSHFCSSGPLGLVLHSHQHPLDISDFSSVGCPQASSLMTPPPLATVPRATQAIPEGLGRAEGKHSVFCLYLQEFFQYKTYTL